MTLPADLRLPVSRLYFELRANRLFDLPPYAATTLRGALGTALRARTCQTGAPVCDGCAVANQCVYGTVWDGALPDGVQLPRRMDPQAPYVVNAPFQYRPYSLRPGETFVFDVTLIGSARRHWRDVIMAARDASVRGLGRSSGAESVVLQWVWAAQPDSDEPYSLYREEKGMRPDAMVPAFELPALNEPLDVDGRPVSIRLLLLTPLVLVREREVLQHFDPVTFTKRLKARVEMLARITTDFQGEIPAQPWLDYAEAVTTGEQFLEDTRFERHSRRQENAIPMQGIIGDLLLHHVHPELLRLWRAAEWIHCGKQAAFGFGAIRILPG